MRWPAVALAASLAACLPGCLETDDCRDEGVVVPYEWSARNETAMAVGLAAASTPEGIVLTVGAGESPEGALHARPTGLHREGDRIVLQVDRGFADGLTGEPSRASFDVWVNGTLAPGTYQVHLCMVTTYPLGDDRVDRVHAEAIVTVTG